MFQSKVQTASLSRFRWCQVSHDHALSSQRTKKYEDLRYIQVAKRIITIRTRELEIGTYEPSEETVYTKDFPEDETPGSWLARGFTLVIRHITRAMRNCFLMTGISK